MRLQEGAPVGMKVRVREDHRIKELRGTVGKVVGSYGRRVDGSRCTFPRRRLPAIVARGSRRSWLSCAMVAFSSGQEEEKELGVSSFIHPTS